MGRANGAAAQDFSEQFLYWACKQIDGRPDQSGTWVGFAFQATPIYGCCRAPRWPYQPLSQSGGDAQGPPPQAALLEGPHFRTPTALYYEPKNLGVLRQSLATGRPVAYTIPIHQSWWQDSPAVRQSGNIPIPLSSEPTIGTHALCLVGYDETQRRFIIRNSFGARWGAQSVYGIGYGTLPYDFASRLGMEAYALP